MIQGDGEKHKIYLKGNLMSLESSTEIPYGNTTHYLEIVEREKDKDELDALRTSFNHINARNQLMPCQKTLEKENKSMTITIKKQPVEITLEELKQGNEYEEVNIYIDVDKQAEIEKRYGITYRYDNVLSSSMFGASNSEIDFKEHYMVYGREKVPYEIIEKIEVVEK